MKRKGKKIETKEEIKEWILQNCVDHNGNIDISKLDFTGFKGNVYRGAWKVDGDLLQSSNEVKGDLSQSYNKVEGNLHQCENEIKGNLCQEINKVKGHLWQDDNEVGGNLYQCRNKVEGNLHQCGNETKGDLFQHGNKVKGKTCTDFEHHNKIMKRNENNEWVEDERFAKPLENMTKQELIKMIKELTK